MREKLKQEAESLLDLCRERGLMIATAESCTGGLLSAYLTAIAGASDVLERGFVTYSNAAKAEMLSVEPRVIEALGAVSKEVALAMSAGALLHSRAHISAAITGVAGPGGGTETKPVGLVHFAVAKRKAMSAGQMDYSAIHHSEHFGDIGRNLVQEESVAVALKLLRQAVEL
jgi:nicotinamide-nucleotide amidase